MLCTRHEMSCTFNPNLSWIHHHTEEKLFEFVLERRHATAVQQRWMLLDDVSIFMDWATHSSGTGGKFWIKGAIDELVQVWHLLLLLYGGRGRQIYYLVSILPLQWSVLSRFELLLRLRGAFKKKKWEKLVFWTNRRTPSPPPRKLVHLKVKKNFDVYFAF